MPKNESHGIVDRIFIHQNSLSERYMDRISLPLYLVHPCQSSYSFYFTCFTLPLMLFSSDIFAGVLLLIFS